MTSSTALLTYVSHFVFDIWGTKVSFRNANSRQPEITRRIIESYQTARIPMHFRKRANVWLNEAWLEVRDFACANNVRRHSMHYIDYIGKETERVQKITLLLSWNFYSRNVKRKIFDAVPLVGMQRARAYPRIHTHTHTHTHIYIYICVCVYMYTYTQIIHTSTLTYIYTHTWNKRVVEYVLMSKLYPLGKQINRHCALAIRFSRNVAATQCVACREFSFLLRCCALLHLSSSSDLYSSFTNKNTL